MKNTNLFTLVLFFTSMFILTSCQQEETSIELDESIDKTYLFDEIEITKDANGTNIFVETDESKIKYILNKLIIEEQNVLSKIDEYGFKMSKGNNPRELFYIKEYINGKVITANYYLDGQTESNSINSVETRQGPYIFYLCMAEECCQSCDINDYSCYCWDINTDCSFGGGNTSCTRLIIVIGG